MTELYHNLNVKDYKSQFVDADEPHLLLDVRNPDEYDEAHIPNAVLFPLDTLYDRFNEISTDTPIVVVCRSGVRSVMAIQILRAVGLADVTLYNLTGGTIAWQKHGLPLDSSEIDE